jgi:hypothetical protein
VSDEGLYFQSREAYSATVPRDNGRIILRMIELHEHDLFRYWADGTWINLHINLGQLNILWYCARVCLPQNLCSTDLWNIQLHMRVMCMSISFCFCKSCALSPFASLLGQCEGRSPEVGFSRYIYRGCYREGTTALSTKVFISICWCL